MVFKCHLWKMLNFQKNESFVWIEENWKKSFDHNSQFSNDQQNAIIPLQSLRETKYYFANLLSLLNTNYCFSSFQNLDIWIEWEEKLKNSIMWKDIRIEMWTFANNSIFLWKIFALRRWINKNAFVFDIQRERNERNVLCASGKYLLKYVILHTTLV